MSKLEEELVAVRKAAIDERPLVDRLAGCREYIKRAEKRVASSESSLKCAQEAHSKLVEDLQSHRDQLAKLEEEERSYHLTEDIAEPASIAVGQDTEDTIEELRWQVEALKQEHKAAKTKLIAQGNAALEKVRAEAMQQLQAERDAARAQAQRDMTPEVSTSDVSTLEQEIIQKQSEMTEAKTAKDMAVYTSHVEEHAKPSAALVRAMRLRQRRETHPGVSS